MPFNDSWQPFPSYDIREVPLFQDMYIEVAEHVPYNHASQDKLVTVMDLVLGSREIVEPTGDPETDRMRRYFFLGSAIIDTWNSSKPSEGAEAYVNFQSFSARITERDILPGTTLEFYTCQDIFEAPSKVAPSEIEPHVMAASQCILMLGRRMYDEMLDHGDGRASATPKQWRKWREELEAAVSREPPRRYAGLSEEAKALAGSVAEEMRTIERKMGVPIVLIGFWRRVWLRMQCTRLSRIWPL